MNKTIKKVALLAVLSVAAVGCQKETITVNPPTGVEASSTELVYESELFN